MALASGEKPSTFLDRCKSGTPKIQLDLNRLNRLASLGLPRRVPCSNQGRDSPFDPADRKIESPASKAGDSLSSQVGGKTSIHSVDSGEARKRKADRDVSSCRERSHGRQAEGRAHPNIRSNLDIVADVRSRRAVDSAKEVLVFQDKENINPCGEYISREPKKLASDRSAEKRKFQVSSKLQNVPNSRKVGSLLVKSRGRVGRNDAGVPSLLPQNAFLEKEQAQQVSIHESYPLPDGQEEQHLDCDMLTPTDSMSISYAHPGQNNDIHHLQTHTDTEAEMLEVPKEFHDENEHRDGVLTSVKELSSSMNGLALADPNLHDDLHSSSIPHNANHKSADLHLSSHPTIASDGRQTASSIQATGLPVSSAPAGTACSITIRTESAPLATTFTDENVQPLECKSSQENVERKQQQAMLPKKEKQSPPKSVLAENGAVKPEQERSSQDDVPISDIGAGKLVQHLQMPEKKAVVNTGEVIMQPKKQGENDYFVWVNGKRYQKLKKIGRGGSSEVYKVIDRDSNIYALKRIKLKGRDYATACGFYQEIELLTRLQGKKYIIRLIDHEVTDKKLFSYDIDGSHIIRHDAHIYMVLEFGEVDLATMLQDKLKERAQSNIQIDETWLRFYWQQILEAVNTVHEERIMHADLKPANFLLVKGVLKLIDFGIAKSIQGDTTNIERDAQVGTLNYMSPEAFLMNEKDENGNIIKCGRSSDIWALGCILYQMVYGKTPFAHITTLHAKIQEVANPRHKINYPPLSNPHLLDIMKKCLAYNRDERLRIPELLKHPFLQPQLAQPLVPKNVEEEILLEILSEEKQGRDITALRRVLERIRMLK